MNPLTRYLTKYLSVRISLMVVSAVALLLTVALFVMFHYSRKAVRTEALQKASKTLEATTQHIDNIMLSVEQTAGNIYFEMLPNLHDKQRLLTYCRQMIETNPYVVGTAIAMKPGFFGTKDSLFLAYIHRNHGQKLHTAADKLTQLPTFGNIPYTEQAWYTEPMASHRASWLEPLDNDEATSEPIITFSLPIFNAEGGTIGVMGVDVTLGLLSKIVMAAKPSPNSYAMLMDSNGKLFIHPDSNRLLQQAVDTSGRGKHDRDRERVSNAMRAGETGYSIFDNNGTNEYVFYKPFERADVKGRSKNDLRWSAALVYPEDDIFGDYHRVRLLILAVAIGGLLLLLVLCQVITHHELLPLRILTRSVRRIAKGQFHEPIPDSHQSDEVGQLQDQFQLMQQALAANMDEADRVTNALKAQSQTLSEAYDNAREADNVKTSFLHHMTNQMMAPVVSIVESVTDIRDNGRGMAQDQVRTAVDNITHQGDQVAQLLNDLLAVSQDKSLRPRRPDDTLQPLRIVEKKDNEDTPETYTQVAGQKD